jgi:UDP-N-acetylmuramyl pentapeptide phosphotransferase/UDP-N-acetylglucosamine-1-phosphate transferase
MPELQELEQHQADPRRCGRIGVPPLEFMLLWLLALGLASALGTQACLWYARRRGLLDHAGPRRSHAGSMPRGGGLAIVLALAGGCFLLVSGGWLEPSMAWRFALAMLAVGAIDWLDDHRPLPAWLRLLVHLGAATSLVLPSPAGAGWLPVLLAVLLLATAVNFWNFMDGINGIASLQAVFVAAVLAYAFAQHGEGGLSLLALAVVATCLGFLPFNLPTARIFLGDVGSGGIGFAVGALLLFAVQRGVLDVWTALLLPSAFWLDAGLTLASRMLRGRRWYTAHREHLYQWLARRGRSHTRVDALFALWNLLIVLPAYLLIAADRVPALPVLLLVSAAGAVLWLSARRRLLHDARLYGFR